MLHLVVRANLATCSTTNERWFDEPGSSSGIRAWGETSTRLMKPVKQGRRVTLGAVSNPGLNPSGLAWASYGLVTSKFRLSKH